MNKNNELMTSVGYDILVSELKDLKTNQRPKIVEEIDIARSHGDLKENAEYHAAKEKQSFIDGRISELSALLTKAKIVDPSKLDHSRICFGSTVKIINLDTQKITTYTLSGILESNPDENIIYYNTPIGTQLINKKVGDIAEINLPTGLNELEILDISYKA